MDIEYYDDPYSEDEEDFLSPPPSSHFPAIKYAMDIEEQLVEFLPTLRIVELSVSGNLPDYDEHRIDRGPDCAIDYIFIILTDINSVEARLVYSKEHA